MQSTDEGFYCVKLTARKSFWVIYSPMQNHLENFKSGMNSRYYLKVNGCRNGQKNAEKTDVSENFLG